jgi:hypothetical protein
LILEAISFKLALDFFTYLKKNGVISNTIKMDFFDRVKHEYTNFATIEDMQSYYNLNYIPIDNCTLGDLGSIQSFLSISNTYNFDINYKVNDVTGNLVINQSSGFDIQRNSQRAVFKDRQLNLIKNTIGEYLSFYNEIKRIYITGIYSPCYAVPGWTENTWYLNSLRSAITAPNNLSQFPYRDKKIETKPPK